MTSTRLDIQVHSSESAGAAEGASQRLWDAQRGATNMQTSVINCDPHTFTINFFFFFVEMYVGVEQQFLQISWLVCATCSPDAH